MTAWNADAAAPDAAHFVVRGQQHRPDVDYACELPVHARAEGAAVELFAQVQTWLIYSFCA